MGEQVRFGRRLPLPSTNEIKHELRLMAASDSIRAMIADGDKPLSKELISGIVDGLAQSHNLTPARARMLIDRLLPDDNKAFQTHTIQIS